MAVHVGSAAWNAALVGEPDSRRRLETPALVLDLDALDRNLARMAERARARGMALRPHAKTHKSVDLARAQIAAGAVGVCAAKLGELEPFHAAGLDGLLLTAPLASPRKIERLAALAAAGPRLVAVADRAGLVEAMAAACSAAGAGLDLLVEVDVGQERTGVGSPAEAVELARRIAAAGPLRFVGVQGYAGHLQHVASFGERRAATAVAMRRLSAVVEALRDAGLPPGIVSGGGTGSHAIDLELGVLTELQVGSYLFMDTDYGAVDLDGQGDGQGDGECGDAAPAFETSLTVHTTVIAHSAAGHAITDAGTKSFGIDGPPPRPLDGVPAGTRYAFAGDEFGRLERTDGGPPPPVGTRVVCAVPHCDPTVNLYDVYHTVRGDRLVGFRAIDGRGRSD